MKKLLILLIFLAGCATDIPVETGPAIEAYFCPRDNCTQIIVEKINSANEVKCALYSVSLPEVLEALEKAEWITDDKKGALMHNKFCIFDGEEILTGSWNPTRSRKANNVVLIHSSTLARNYLDEFSELPGGYRRVKHPKVSYNNRIIENYFCPEDDCKEQVIDELSAAKQRIVFLLASFTDRDIMNILKEKKKVILVEGFIDKSQKEALEIVDFANPGLIHHKVFIIDDKTVITGSYNPTKSGDTKNDENILIIHDRSVAQKFLGEYNYLIS